MSAIILDRAHEALALGELKKPIPAAGNLQGRKIVPIPYYLLVGGAILGGIAAISLTVAAVSLAIFPLLVAAAASALLSLTNAIAALIIHKLAPQKEINHLIHSLSEKVKNLVALNQNLKIEQLRNQRNPVQVNEKADQEINQLNQQLNEQKLKLHTNKENLLEFAKNHNEDLQLLQDNLEELILSVQERGEDIAYFEELKHTIKKINTDDKSFNAKDALDQLHQNNRAILEQYSGIVTSLVKYVEVCENDQLEEGCKKDEWEKEKERLENEIEKLNQEKVQLREKIAEDEKMWGNIKELVRSDSIIKV